MNEVFAQTLFLPGGKTVISGIASAPDSIGVLVSRAIPYLFAFAGFGLLLVIIIAGFTLLTAGGDAKKVESGKQRLTYAIVGFLIIFASFWLVQIVGKIFGLKPVQEIFTGQSGAARSLPGGPR